MHVFNEGLAAGNGGLHVLDQRGHVGFYHVQLAFPLPKEILRDIFQSAANAWLDRFGLLALYATIITPSLQSRTEARLGEGQGPVHSPAYHGLP